MDVVINKRKIRDTVGQIVAGGNRAVKQEARHHFGKTHAGKRGATESGFSFAIPGNVVPVVYR